MEQQGTDPLPNCFATLPTSLRGSSKKLIRSKSAPLLLPLSSKILLRSLTAPLPTPIRRSSKILLRSETDSIRSTPLHHTPGAMAAPEQNAPAPHSCLGQLGFTIQHFVNPASRQQEEPITKYKKQHRNDRSSETSQLSMW